mmetsp:Transcript_941/g.3128  ORF Transcript_941/g.3128 Transcript_941/m.3128 type:complete len:240 (+) Transcript_941:175-894(+)
MALQRDAREDAAREIVQEVRAVVHRVVRPRVLPRVGRVEDRADARGRGHRGSRVVVRQRRRPIRRIRRARDDGVLHVRDVRHVPPDSSVPGPRRGGHVRASRRVPRRRRGGVRLRRVPAHVGVAVHVRDVDAVSLDAVLHPSDERYRVHAAVVGQRREGVRDEEPRASGRASDGVRRRVDVFRDVRVGAVPRVRVGADRFSEGVLVRQGGCEREHTGGRQVRAVVLVRQRVSSELDVVE